MPSSTDAKTSWKLLAGIALVSMILGYFLYTSISVKTPEQVLSTSVGASKKGGSIGSHRPDFELPDINGKPFSSSDMDGKVVLVNFWATWCPPCRKEIPGFIALKTRYAEKGFDIIGIAIDELAAVQKFSEQFGVNYPILYGQEDASEVSRRYGNTMGALPFSVLVDRQGNVRFLRAGELHQDQLEQELLKYL